MHKKRILTSAPILSLAVIGFVASAWLIEHQMRQNNQSLMAFALSSDDGQEFEARISTALPDPLSRALTQAVVEAPLGTFRPEALQALSVYESAAPEQQLAMIAYAGRMLSARNRFEEALETLNLLNDSERHRFDASFAFAETLKGMGDDDAAIAAYTDLIANNPNHQAGHINFAILLMRINQHEAARPVLERAIQITDGRRRGKALSLLGILFSEMNDFDQAAETFQASIEYRPSHAPTWRRLAVAQGRSGTFEQAEVIATFQRATSLASSDSRSESALAEFYFSVGRFDDALPHFRSASRSAQFQGEVLLNRALNLYVSERPSAARNVVRTLKMLNLTSAQDAQLDFLDDILSGSSSSVMRHLGAPDPGVTLIDREVFLQILGHLVIGDIETASLLAGDLAPSSRFFQPAKFLIARSLFRADRREEARSILTDLIDGNEHSPIFWLYLGRAEATPAAALIAHRTAHELLPRSGRMAIEYAEALNSVGQPDQATAVLFEYLDQRPNEPRALRSLAGIYDANQRLDRAEQIYRILYDLNTDDVSVGLALADIQYRAERFEPALVTLDSLVELQPSRIAIRQRRTEILSRLGQEAEVRVELDRILRLDPENEFARTALATMAG